MLKVKVSRKEYEALVSFTDIHHTLEDAVEAYINGNHKWIDIYVSLREMGLKKFIECLMFEYEKEETPEERLRKVYDRANKSAQLMEQNNLVKNLDTGCAYGIREACRILGHEVEGVWTRADVESKPE